MKYFVLLTGLILACYLLGFIKKSEKYQWMDRNYTTAIKGFSILTVVWAHSGAMLSVGGIQFVAGIGVALFLMCSGYGLEISYEKNGLEEFWKKRLLSVCLPFWVVELVGLYIDEKLNPYPEKLDAYVYENKGDNAWTADFACSQCGKFGVSIHEEFLPIGRCCYCGWDNELEKCDRCGQLVDVDVLENGLCPSCSAYIDKQ